MTPQFEADELLRKWWRGRDAGLPPEQRLDEDATVAERPPLQTNQEVKESIV